MSSLMLSIQMVAKVLTKQEIANNPKARQAMKEEYYGLQNAGTWDLSRVMPKWKSGRRLKTKDEWFILHEYLEFAQRRLNIPVSSGFIAVPL